MTNRPMDVFVDFVSSVSHANGVFRVTMSQQTREGKAEEAVRLLIPAVQLQAVLKGMAEGANEIREQLQAQRDAQGDDAAGTTPAEGGVKK